MVTKTLFPKKRAKGPRVGRDVVATLVRQALNLSSDREANHVVNVVIDSIVTVIRENIDTNGFLQKLPSFGKFEVRHKKGKLRKIPLTGKVQMTADKRKGEVHRSVRVPGTRTHANRVAPGVLCEASLQFRRFRAVLSSAVCCGAFRLRLRSCYLVQHADRIVQAGVSGLLVGGQSLPLRHAV